MLRFVFIVIVLVFANQAARADSTEHDDYYLDPRFAQQLIVTKCDPKKKVFTVRNFEFGYELVTQKTLKLLKKQFGKQYNFFLYEDETKFNISCDIGKIIDANFIFVGTEEQNKRYGFLDLTYDGFPVMIHESILNEGKYLYRYDYIKINSQELYTEFGDHAEFPGCSQHKIALSKTNLSKIKEIFKRDVNADLFSSKELMGAYNHKTVTCNENRNSTDEDVYFDLDKLIEDIKKW